MLLNDFTGQKLVTLRHPRLRHPVDIAVCDNLIAVAEGGTCSAIWLYEMLSSDATSEKLSVCSDDELQEDLITE